MSLSKKATLRSKVELDFSGMKFEPTWDGKNKVFTFGLEDPITMMGSTTYNNLATQERDQTPKVTDAVTVKIMDIDLDAAEDEFITEGEGTEDSPIRIIGYKGTKLVLDVSKPRYNQINGMEQQPCHLWLKSTRFSETPRATMNREPAKMSGE